jgi:hypothetical protein
VAAELSLGAHPRLQLAAHSFPFLVFPDIIYYLQLVSVARNFYADREDSEKHVNY